MLKLITCRIRGAELNKLRELPNIKPIADSATPRSSSAIHLSVLFSLATTHPSARHLLTPASEPIAMSAPGGAPSPGPRSGSMGPGANGGGMPMSSQPPLSGTPVHQPPTPGQSGPMSQQNLNQIVSYVV